MEKIGSLYDFVEPSKKSYLHHQEYQSTNLVSDNVFTEKPKGRNRNKTTFDEEHLTPIKLTVDRVRRPSEQIKFFHKVEQWKLSEELDKMRESRNQIKFSLAQFSKKEKEEKEENSNTVTKIRPFETENRLLRSRNIFSQNDEQKVVNRRMFLSEDKDYKQTELKLEPLSKAYGNKILMTEKGNPRVDTFSSENVKTKRKLSDWERVEFEVCLSWAKKHHKIGNYYLEQLGKSKEKDFLLVQAEKRKSDLLSLKEKYSPEKKHPAKPFFHSSKK